LFEKYALACYPIAAAIFILLSEPPPGIIEIARITEVHPSMHVGGYAELVPDRGLATD
jgi:hypothetical protein